MVASSKNNLYGFPQPLSRVFPAPIVAQRAPTTSDIAYPPGQVWDDQAGGNIYFLVEVIGGSAVWELAAGTNAYPITPYVVGPNGGYSTIQSALDAANTAGIPALVYVQSGTYTENLTLYDSIFLQGAVDNTTIIGVHTPPASGTLILDSLILVSATHILSSAVAGTTDITIQNSFIIITNGFVFNLLNWTGTLLFDNCGEASANDGVVNNTGGAGIKFLNTEMGAGSGQTMTLTGNGNLRFDTCNVNCPVNIGGSGTLIMQNGCKFANTVTIGGSKTSSIVDTAFLTGANQALVYNSTGAGFLSGVTINSSNNPAIGGTGAGLLTLAGISFVSDSNIAATLTLNSADLVASSSLRTNSLTTGSTLSSSTWAATGSNTNISMAITPKGSGEIQLNGPVQTNITFAQSPVLQSSATTGAAPSGATGAVNLMALQEGEIMEQFILGAGQTIIAPRMSTTGLLTSLDLVATEGAEYNWGMRANALHTFTIGTSPAFFLELQVSAADIGGLDPLLAGFRIVQANDATLANYTDFAGIGANATTAADVVIIQTQLNTGGVVITNTTDAWTDGQTRTFRINVSAAGVVTYLINGVAPTVTAAFTFDTGDVVAPFIRHLFGATNPGAINWISMRVGLQ